MRGFGGFKRYRRYFKNYIHIALSVIFNRFPIVIVFRDGDNVIAKNPGFVHLASTGLKFQYEEKSDILSFNFNGINLKFHGVFFNNDLADTFGFEVYAMPYFQEKTVVDIGANIGDTSVYFVLKGAKRVIALEPSPFAFRYLEENAERNGIKEKIICLNEGVGRIDSSIKMERNERDVTGTKAVNQGHGVTVHIMTLKNLIETEGIQSGSVLKMDCEGCEYDSLLSSDCDTLAVFQEIIMEYHNDPTPLVRKLSECGYSVKLNGKDIHEVSTNVIGYKYKGIGYIYAKFVKSYNKQGKSVS